MEAADYNPAMPIYEYRCRQCAERFEELRRSSDGADVVCPACGGTQVKRMMSIFSAVLSSPGKGSTGACSCGGSCACAG